MKNTTAYLRFINYYCIKHTGHEHTTVCALIFAAFIFHGFAIFTFLAFLNSRVLGTVVLKYSRVKYSRMSFDMLFWCQWTSQCLHRQFFHGFIIPSSFGWPIQRNTSSSALSLCSPSTLSLALSLNDVRMLQCHFSGIPGDLGFLGLCDGLVIFAPFHGPHGHRSALQQLQPRA